MEILDGSSRLPGDMVSTGCVSFQAVESLPSEPAPLRYEGQTPLGKHPNALASRGPDAP